eukprot:11189683-Lingulodinium_polyedra.AAC.1
MATFDGGSRTARGVDIAAGSTVLWLGDPPGRGEWRRVRTLTRTFPSGATARAAEAWAARTAL